ncbi:thymidine kinase [Parapedobacter composti]|uniref:Thymidine kinase n=1 Tax=Parapedobacter composti TaxID=623281 RepID=A0A1I1ECN2_9SPHI|nr:thymidine kinase [Parapedobacter composti]SFB84516.1 thymidine kinase [Parapedobacter composti]
MLFSEDRFRQRDASYGSIEVICGSMFSGKTEELIRRMRRAQFAKLSVELFKPKIDTRYHDTYIISHDSNSIPSLPVENSLAMLAIGSETSVVGIDEAQFFDENLPDVCTTLANKGIRVIVAGLDMDFKGRPFGPVPNLMAIAEHVTKVHAVCMRCGAPATYSYRIAAAEQQLLLGEKEHYEPRCRACFFQHREV